MRDFVILLCLLGICALAFGIGVAIAPLIPHDGVVHKAAAYQPRYCNAYNLGWDAYMPCTWGEDPRETIRA